MCKHVVGVLGAMGVFLLCSTAFAQQLQEGVLLQADGKEINIEVGHLVPVVTDWNEDGKKDLLIGQFSGGKIGLYLNTGTDSAPELKFQKYLEAGGAEISLPAG